MNILELKMVIFGLVNQLHYSGVFLTHGTTIIHEQYIESQLCSKLTILNTQSPVVWSKMAVLGLIMAIFGLMY